MRQVTLTKINPSFVSSRGLDSGMGGVSGQLMIQASVQMTPYTRSGTVLGHDKYAMCEGRGRLPFVTCSSFSPLSRCALADS